MKTVPLLIGVGEYGSLVAKAFATVIDTQFSMPQNIFYFRRWAIGTRYENPCRSILVKPEDWAQIQIRGFEYIEELGNRVDTFAQNTTTAFLFVGLWDTFSSMAMRFILNHFKAQGIKVVLVAYLPYDFIGHYRYEHIKRLINKIAEKVDCALLVRNDVFCDTGANRLLFDIETSLHRTVFTLLESVLKRDDIEKHLKNYTIGLPFLEVLSRKTFELEDTIHSVLTRENNSGNSIKNGIFCNPCS